MRAGRSCSRTFPAAGPTGPRRERGRRPTGWETTQSGRLDGKDTREEVNPVFEMLRFEDYVHAFDRIDNKHICKAMNPSGLCS